MLKQTVGSQSFGKPFIRPDKKYTQNKIVLLPGLYLSRTNIANRIATIYFFPKDFNLNTLISLLLRLKSNALPLWFEYDPVISRIRADRT